MLELVPACILLCMVLATYLLHSTLLIVATHCVLDRFGWVTHPELRVLGWKLALVLPVVSALGVTIFDLPHCGLRVPISIARENCEVGGTPTPMPSAAVPAVLDTIGPSDRARDMDSYRKREHGGLGKQLAEIPATSSPRVDFNAIVSLVSAAWLFLVGIGFYRLVFQLHQLRRLRREAAPVGAPELSRSLRRLRKQFGIRRPIVLLQSSRIRGPMTAGVWRPFILLPAGMRWDDAAERDALMAHELVHIARRDAFWNLLVQILRRAVPCQPLVGFAGRQLRKEMDFVADLLAVQTTAARLGLAHSLIRLGDRLTTGSRMPHSTLAACMASFDSALGRRIEVLLAEDGWRRRSSRWGRLAVVLTMLATTVTATACVPRAVAQHPRTFTEQHFSFNARKDAMSRQMTTLAIFFGLSVPLVAEEPPPKTEKQGDAATANADLKTTPDPLPRGMVGFNGMLVGRLAAKDVEKGTFVVLVDAVPRVWRNSKADAPKSIVGKTVEVSGVFGRFLDVLVVTRAGETVEFECRHDGEKLVFPGELLRKVAKYDPADYPELPESFRGFAGTAVATILKKDPETFELIVKVDRITETWEGNKAASPNSIAGKSMMLAGFWNRKDAYHALKVGDKIEFGMRHIENRSDHLSVTKYVRKAGDRPDREVSRSEREVRSAGEAADPIRGFRGMLVGRLVEKDIERGSFTITVDAVPRVWNNNKSTAPKALLGTRVKAEGVTGRMLDALVVAKPGETIEFGALHDGEDRLRVGEVLRKVAPVKPGDYPVLPDGFRGFKGMVTAEVVRKDDHLMDLVVEIKEVKQRFANSRAKRPESIVGQRAMLGGFWQRKEAFHSIGPGDTIEVGVDHPQPLSDHLTVIESIKKVEAK